MKMMNNEFGMNYVKNEKGIYLTSEKSIILPERKIVLDAPSDYVKCNTILPEPKNAFGILI